VKETVNAETAEMKMLKRLGVLCELGGKQELHEPLLELIQPCLTAI
jgi:hypothetical protein